MSHRGLTQPEGNIKREKDVLDKKTLDTLKDKLSGVKYATFNLTEAQENFFAENSESTEAQILQGITSYLKSDLGMEVLVTRAARQQLRKLSNPSACDYALVGYRVRDVKSSFPAGKFSFTLSIKFCDESRYSFETELSFNVLTDYVDLIRKVCVSHFPISREYDEKKKSILPKGPFIISQRDFEKYLDSGKVKKPIEGIYQLSYSENGTPKYKIGIYNHNDTLKIVYFGEEILNKNWIEGEIKGYLASKKSESVYIGQWIGIGKIKYTASLHFLDDISFEMSSSQLDGKDKYVRIK
ncbi:MAG TPA: hypothetical protein VGQ53_13765 [Chitinophagaceae bacterium]|nr:hypothetical protein [Chitinophagaceae bacterium]